MAKFSMRKIRTFEHDGKGGVVSHRIAEPYHLITVCGKPVRYCADRPGRCKGFHSGTGREDVVPCAACYGDDIMALEATIAAYWRSKGFGA